MAASLARHGLSVWPKGHGMVAGLFGLLIAAAAPSGAAQLAPTLPPVPPIEIRSPLTPDSGIRSVDPDSCVANPSIGAA